MEQLDLNISVSQLANINEPVNCILNDLEGKQWLSKNYTNLIFKIEYPVNTSLTVNIPQASGLADILVPLAKAYKDIIYKDVETINTYGVWGHDIEDLFFEGIVIHEDKDCELYIGS